MFFKQVWRNCAKNRKGNGLFFGSLTIAIVAFYTLLSLGEQDVMRFLTTLESDAVRKLLALLPMVYMISLFFVFFLVYFACRYQADSRRREFGMYLLLGMRQSRLFLLLFCETLCSSLISLLMGIPIALFLTEGVSLATAKIVGLGIIEHRFSFSPGAVLWTVCGFVIVQLLSMLIICVQLYGTEPAAFLRSDASRHQLSASNQQNILSFVLGAALLLIAYYLGIFHMRSLRLGVFAAVFIFGASGTFFFFRGLGNFLGGRAQAKSPLAVGLETFTARQVQESVFSQHKALAISSLLLLIGFSCISYGISLGVGRAVSSRSTDFSLFGEEERIDSILAENEIREMIKDSYPLHLSFLKEEYWAKGEKALDLSKLAEAVGAVEGTENILQNLRIEYVIAESSYNCLLAAMGKEEIRLGTDKVALYTSMHRDAADFYSMMEQALKKEASVGINGVEYPIIPTLCYENIVADRAISLYMALILPDALYEELAREFQPFCRNVHLTDEVTQEMGLMLAVQKMEGMLEETGLTYDSFLGGIGRNLFYTVSASYLTVYLGILFFIIANTVIGLKFLIQQRQTRHRYVTLFMLGADDESMCRSVRKQIQTFFGLVLGVSVVSSAAAVISLFTSLTKLPAGTSPAVLITLAAVVMIFFIVVEILYLNAVKRTACREIRQLRVTDRR